MFFLLNDVVLNLSAKALTPPMTARRFRALDFASVCKLGQELFADNPRLQHTHPEQAERLGLLLLAKGGSVNAALFVAPALDCDPEEVGMRFADVDFAVLAALAERQQAGKLTPYYADRQVWRRMAA